MITDHGIYDIPTDAYLADPVKGGSLSSSALREFDKSPQHYRSYIEHGSKSSKSMDFGSAAHVRVLGTGHDIAVMQHDGRTKAGRAERKEAEESGAIIVSKDEAEQIEGMTEALLADEQASALLVPDEGLIEHTFVWPDRETGTNCRAMLDFVRHLDDDGQRIIVDYKTARSVDPDEIERAIYNYGYFRAGAWYRAGVETCAELGHLPPARITRFFLIMQESSRPWAPVVVPVEEWALEWGRVMNRATVDRYLEAVELDAWPGPARGKWLPRGIPHWARRRLEDADAEGVFDTRADRLERLRIR